MLLTLLGFVIVLGTMVIVHEFGHFIVAKLLGIKVETFSVGFGPRLFGLKLGDTDYRLSAVPLGGYVKMKGENLDEELSGDKDEFMSHSKFHRLLVAVAGPMFNIGTALLIPTVAIMIGVMVPRISVESARVGATQQGSPAQEAGLRPGDRIVNFAGIENPNWRDVDMYTSINPGIPISLIVERDNKRVPLTLTPKTVMYDRDKIGESGLLPMITFPTIVGQVAKDTPASRGGLQPGDKIVGIDGVPMPDFYHVSRIISASAGKEVRLTIERNGQRFDQPITPELKDDRGQIGFVNEEERILRRETNPISAFKFALDENRRIISLTVTAFGQVFAGNRDVRETVAGPVRIAQFSGQALREGWYQVFSLMALLSLNLGIFNLLPIPVLDGGLIFMIGMEGVLGWFGRPLTLGLKEKMMQVGFVVLVLLMGLVIFNDVLHVIPKW